MLLANHMARQDSAAKAARVKQKSCGGTPLFH
jgi:hypothetical protein